MSKSQVWLIFFPYKNTSNLIYIYILLDAIDVIAIPNLSIIHKSTIFNPFKVTFLASNKQNPLKFRLPKQEKNKTTSKIQSTQFTPTPKKLPHKKTDTQRVKNRIHTEANNCEFKLYCAAVAAPDNKGRPLWPIRADLDKFPALVPNCC